MQWNRHIAFKYWLAKKSSNNPGICPRVGSGIVATQRKIILKSVIQFRHRSFRMFLSRDMSLVQAESIRVSYGFWYSPTHEEATFNSAIADQLVTHFLARTHCTNCAFSCKFSEVEILRAHLDTPSVHITLRAHHLQVSFKHIVNQCTVIPCTRCFRLHADPVHWNVISRPNYRNVGTTTTKFFAVAGTRAMVLS